MQKGRNTCVGALKHWNSYKLYKLTKKCSYLPDMYVRLHLRGCLGIFSPYVLTYKSAQDTKHEQLSRNQRSVFLLVSSSLSICKICNSVKCENFYDEYCRVNG